MLLHMFLKISLLHEGFVTITTIEVLDIEMDSEMHNQILSSFEMFGTIPYSSLKANASVFPSGFFLILDDFIGIGVVVHQLF